MLSKGIISPERFFGFQMGADRKIARWDKIVEYFWHLNELSDRIKVIELGKSTENNPYILAIISSAENLNNLEKIREMSWRIAHPKGLSDQEIENIIKNGKSVVEITNSQHATEIGGTQMSPELAYELITSEDPVFKTIRENTVLLLLPCVNPDGEIMVVDWYNKWLETEYEGVGQPWLYHKYVGHDNNRDTIISNMVETQMWAKLTFQEWYPQAYFDHHHMGSYGARLYVPPLAPGWIDPNVDPLIWTEQRLYGGNMSNKLEAEGKTGIEHETFVDEFMTTTNHVCRRMGICGMLSESASAKLATPMYIHYHQLQGELNRPEYNAQHNFPHPWPGGWWRLRDIVEQQKIASLAVLEIAALFRERILRSMYMKATRAIKEGTEKPPYAFILPPYQDDPLTVLKFLKAYRALGIEIHQAKKDFIAENIPYPAGSYIIFLSQIARPYILATIQKSLFKDEPWNRKGDGTPVPTKDPAASTLVEYMGVKAIEVANKFSVDSIEVQEIKTPTVVLVDESQNGYILDGRINDHYKIINILLKNRIKIHRTIEEVKVGDKTFPPGAFYVPHDDGVVKALNKAAEDQCAVYATLKTKPNFHTKEVKPLRIAMYQRYYGGNMQEGWSRWLLEQYQYDYTIVMDKEIKEGNLKEKYDVLILPSDATPMITGKDIEEWWNKLRAYYPLPTYPPEYRSGIGDDGVRAIKEFVEKGGKLITLNESTSFALDEFKLPINNVVKDLALNDFLCSGSTLNVNVDSTHQLGYGMNNKSLLLFLPSSSAFQVKPVENNDKYTIIASYPDSQLLYSGWLIGEKYLHRKAALIDAKYGKGNVLLYGFEPLFRGQTHSTFKLFFNALFE
jgi:hypothetical protein